MDGLLLARQRELSSASAAFKMTGTAWHCMALHGTACCDSSIEVFCICDSQAPTSCVEGVTKSESRMVTISTFAKLCCLSIMPCLSVTVSYDAYFTSRVGLPRNIRFMDDHRNIITVGFDTDSGF